MSIYFNDFVAQNLIHKTTDVSTITQSRTAAHREKQSVNRRILASLFEEVLSLLVPMTRFPMINPIFFEYEFRMGGTLSMNDFSPKR